MYWDCVNFIRKILIISNLSLYTNLRKRSWKFLPLLFATVVCHPYKLTVVMKNVWEFMSFIINNCYYYYHKIYKVFTCSSKLSLQSMLAPEDLEKSFFTINELPRWVCASSLVLMTLISVSINLISWKTLKSCFENILCSITCAIKYSIICITYISLIYSNPEINP